MKKLAGASVNCDILTLLQQCFNSFLIQPTDIEGIPDTPELLYMRRGL
jgi:hypothetical protein